LIAFWDEITGWVNEGRAVDVTYCELNKAFDTPWWCVIGPNVLDQPHPKPTPTSSTLPQLGLSIHCDSGVVQTVMAFDNTL